MEYEIRQTFFETDQEFKQLVELQNAVYGEKSFTTEIFKFWYIDNPQGRVLSFNAFVGEKMIAHYACIPIQMKIGKCIVEGIHSMATVTHPDYRGKGLFKQLARLTYDYAKEHGYKFVLGVANKNSFPGFIKYFNFTFIAQLDVKWGWGNIGGCKRDIIYSRYWDAQSLAWRLNKPRYAWYKNMIVGKYKNIVGLKTLMGYFTPELIKRTGIRETKNIFRPFNLYIGLGADLSKGCYFNFPKFIKHSPFNLIFLDLTDGELPPVNRDNIFFQLIDFDVA